MIESEVEPVIAEPALTPVDPLLLKEHQYFKVELREAIRLAAVNIDTEDSERFQGLINKITRLQSVYRANPLTTSDDILSRESETQKEGILNARSLFLQKRQNSRQ